MSSWSSWFTSLPVFDFTVPSTIQRRFFSFLLRRTLGHFFKPGQLDLHQIDSQLGSGTIQVKDLELDGEAINQLLVGLPVTLYDGFISGVTARIPFPNPLSSTVGCHVQSLNLTFQIAPEQPTSRSASSDNSSSLADSVVSVAETFVHDELTPREESENLPGGFNPFGRSLHTEEARKEPNGEDDPAGVSVFATLIERLLARFEFSAVDTKITLVYPERASITLFVSEIIYHTGPGPGTELNNRLQSTLEGNNHRGQVRTVSISGLKVTSRDLHVATSSSTVTSTLSPVTSTTSRRPSSLQSNPTAGQLSRNSSSSSLDEVTQFMMSESIATLPPNSPHLLSASSSMYQSAISTDNVQPIKMDTSALPSAPLVVDNVDSTGRVFPQHRLLIPSRGSMEDVDVLLSFGLQPIVLALTTPPRLTQSPGQVPQAGEGRPANSEDSLGDKTKQETLQLSVTIGTLACAFHSRHLRVLLDILDAFASKLPSPSPVARKETSFGHPRTALDLETNIVVRGIAMIALPESASGELISLDTFYERPLVPPRLPCTYLRLFLDSLSVSFRFFTPSPNLLMPITPQTSSIPEDESASAKMVISDLSMFIFHGISSADDSHVAAPIVITDHYLPTLDVAQHYRPSFASERPQDIKLPVFEVTDWTQAKFKGGSSKLSTWRLKNRVGPGKIDRWHAPSEKPGDLSSPPDPFIVSPLPDLEDRLPMPPAIQVLGQLAPPFPSRDSSRTVDIEIAPLHLFFDLGMMFEGDLLMRFVEDTASAAIFTQKEAMDNRILCQKELEQLSDMDIEQDAEISLRAREKERERRRLESLVLEDLNLGMSHQRTRTSKRRSSRRSSTSPNKKESTSSQFSYVFRLACPMVRVEVRCPPPPSRPPRSGCMLFDLRGLTISNVPPSTKSHLRFSEGVQLSSPRSSENISDILLNVRLQETLVAYSLVDDDVAHAILTLGFLPTKEVGPDTSALLAVETIPDALPLSVVLGRANTAKQSTNNPASKTSLTVDIPLVNLTIDKAIFDGLQCWADDVAQLIERSFVAPDGATETFSSPNPSLIGSRYFIQSRRTGTLSTNESIGKSDRQNTGAAVVKLSVTEVLLRVFLPRSDHPRHARPFDISALEVGALLKLRSESKESVITAEIMDIRVADTTNEGDCALLLHCPARSLSSASRSSLECRIASFAVPETTTKESRIKLSLWGFTVYPPLDSSFADDLAMFAKAPPGVFESVIPSECTRLTVGIVDVSAHLRTQGHPGAAVLHLGDAEFSTEMRGSSSESTFTLSISSSHFLLVDSTLDAFEETSLTPTPGRGVDFWKGSGYALVAEFSDSWLTFQADNSILPPKISVLIERIGLRIHLCADTIGALTGLITSMTRAPRGDAAVRVPRETLETPNTITNDRDMTASLDEHAFRVVPEVGSTADMISDDLPANQDYLDASFGAAAGLRELRDDDLEDFDTEEKTGHNTPTSAQIGVVSNVGGETVRILKPLAFIEHHFDTIPPDTTRDPDNPSDTTLRVRIHDSDIVLFLHDGFDWPRTRKIVEREVREMRKRLARIRQLVSAGQIQEPIDEMTSTTLFNSLHIGLERDLESMDPDTLIAAIDEELDDPAETGTDSSWQSLHPASPGRPRIASTRVHGKRLTRSKGPSIEIRLEGMSVEIDNYRPGETLVSRMLILVRDLEILDHIKTSTWKKFLTDMRSDSRGNVRETDSNMARIELLSVCPSPSHPAEEARLRAKILPLRLYVDQDALDFFKKFFAFQDPDNPPAPDDGNKKEEIYFQHAEVFPVDIKLDYKPRRVDYRALRDGRTIELMNFFHFDGAEMTLRHLTLHGITGWPRFFDTLNDLWTPDVKATQLVDVISGVAPIRSVVNVGSGVADLVLLPIAQYKKDGRIVRGLQKGTKAFVQSAAMEAIKLSARLATGTQVILEQAESVLGGQFKDSVTAEALQIPYEDGYAEGSDEDLISRYAAQPTGLKEGVQSAYRSLQKNLHSAAQTILAVPMEVYERSGNEGAVRAVVRAVPIAVLKPMIGASEAVSKTLMGLHNTLDPNIRLENEAKYKHR